MAACVSLITACSTTVKSPLPDEELHISELTVDSLAVAVEAGQQREYSFTDKKSAFWYGMTHTDDWDNWYAGWNIAKRRLLSDYTLSVDGDTMTAPASNFICLTR